MPKSSLSRFQRITPQQLRAFEATVRLGSVTRAAKELHVSQPTISVQLRELAATLDEKLFEPRGRQLRLNQAGEELYATVQELNECWQRLESRLAAIHGLVRGRLKIAAVTTAEYFVPELLGAFAAAHPGVDIELAIENRDRIVDRLSQGLDDIAVMMMPPKHLALEQRVLQSNPLVVIAPAKQAAHSATPLTLDDLNEARWLMREPGSGTRMATEAHFDQQGFVPQVAMSLGSNEAIKHAVAAGLGLAVLSEVAIRPSLGPTEQLTQLNVESFPIQRHWYLVWHKKRPLTAAAHHFLLYLDAFRTGLSLPEA